MIPSWRLLPSTGALRAFVAAARHLSFSKAAAELNLTQGAISRHIQALEAQLGLALFNRAGGRVALTDAGQTYLPEVSAALERIATATLSLLAYGGAGGSVDVAILPTFGHRWLVPRLPAFSRAHPDVTLNLVTRSRPFDLDREGIELAVHFGDDDWPGASSIALMGEEVAPVCAPALLATLPEALAPEQLARLNLLHLSTRPLAWRDWFAAIGRPELVPSAGPSFEQFSLVAQAAIAGLGVAIIPLFLFEDELAGGRLVRLPGPTVRSRQGYHLVWSRQRPLTPKARSFVDWLVAAARDYEAATRPR